MIERPYYRIFRPNKHSDEALYILDKNYCKERIDLIRYYNFLQKQVVEVFNYIEPTKDTLETYSFKNYQLLGNICMEVENNLKGILRANGYGIKEEDNWNMTDYKKINQYMKLSEYRIVLNNYNIDEFRPFEEFEKSKKPEWYQCYNSIKHNRTICISQASLKNVLYALGGLNVLLRAQFGIYYDIANDKEDSLIWLQVQNGVYNSQNAVSIFKIIQEPKWHDSEYYDFDWNELKNSDEKFCKLSIK